MKIVERTAGPAIVVSPAGRLDAAGAPVLEDRIFALVGRGDSCIVLDGGGIAFISSAGLRTLLAGAKTCRKEGGGLVLAAFAANCRSVMEASGLLSVLDYRATVETALEVPDIAASAGRREKPEKQGGQTLKTERRDEGPVAVLSLRGRIDGANAPILETRVFGVFAESRTSLVLDCGGMDYINSSGLRALLLCAKACHERNIGFAIAALRPECRSVLAMSGFLLVIDHYDTCESALAALAGTGTA